MIHGDKRKTTKLHQLQQTIMSGKLCTEMVVNFDRNIQCVSFCNKDKDRMQNKREPMVVSRLSTFMYLIFVLIKLSCQLIISAVPFFKVGLTCNAGLRYTTVAHFYFTYFQKLVDLDPFQKVTLKQLGLGSCFFCSDKMPVYFPYPLLPFRFPS